MAERVGNKPSIVLIIKLRNVFFLVSEDKTQKEFISIISEFLLYFTQYFGRETLK